MTHADKGIAPLTLGMTRHKHIQTSLRYQKGNPDMHQTYNKAITGKHVNLPASSPQNKTNTQMMTLDDDKKPPSLIVACQEKAEKKENNCENTLPSLSETDSVTTTNTNYALTNNDYYKMPVQPIITPAYNPKEKTIVQQNYLNNIQQIFSSML
jgi:hypothetical protein